jgi:hypothetical protein
VDVPLQRGLSCLAKRGGETPRKVPVQLMKTGITLPLEIPSRRQEGETGLLCRAERLHGRQ